MTDAAPPARAAGRRFSVRRVPGFAAIAAVSFVLLYAPIVTLVGRSTGVSTTRSTVPSGR